MASALWPLQVAIVAKLRASTALMALIKGIYDEPPKGAKLPYVTVGPLFELPADAHNQRGLDDIVTLHVWSDYKGNKEPAEIFAALDAALDRQPLTVAGWTDVSIALDEAHTTSDPDPDIRHIIATYRVWLTKA